MKKSLFLSMFLMSYLSASALSVYLSQEEGSIQNATAAHAPTEFLPTEEAQEPQYCADIGQPCESQICCPDLTCVALGGNWGWYECVVR